MPCINMAVLERYSASDAILWSDLGLDERDVLPALIRLARAARNTVESAALCPSDARCDDCDWLRESVAAFDFGDADA